MESENHSGVRRLAVEEGPVLRPRPQLVQAEPKLETPPAKLYQTTILEPEKPSAMEVVIHAYTALGYALSARALLLLALVGAFILAILTARQPTYFSLALLTIYCAFTVVPIAYLEVRKGRGA